MRDSMPLAELLDRIRTLESEATQALNESQRRSAYRIIEGKARFEPEVQSHHARLRTGLAAYLARSRPAAVITSPLLYACLLPFVLLDLFMSVYQAICFPVYGIPKVRRRDHFVFDRGRLEYLNLLEKLNCAYCSYANGLCSYVTEIAARTEQHWCPVKHATALKAPHSRYSKFFDYGDAESYARRLEELRADFRDLVDSGGHRRKPAVRRR